MLEVWVKDENKINQKKKTHSFCSSGLEYHMKNKQMHLIAKQNKLPEDLKNKFIVGGIIFN